MSSAPTPSASRPAEALLKATGLTKSFPGVRALHTVGLALDAGTVTALIGENGAGKSTLVKILTGIYTPDAGSISVNGRAVSISSPRDAWHAGITAIHQETVMFDDLTVAENVYMGHMPVNGRGLVDWAAMRQQTAALLARLEADVKPDTLLKRLGVAQKHQVGIARALSHDARIVIMDEPTAALSAREIDDLFRIVATLKEQGRAILFISHKFDEIFRIADRWTCLRDGEQVGDGRIADTDEAKLVKLMVGRAIEQVFPKRTLPIGDIVLDVAGLSNETEFADVSLQLRRSEILGLYGLVGAGRSEAMQALFGIGQASRGTVTLNGQALHIRAPADAIAAGIAYVPEDRQVQGAVLSMPIAQNVTLASLASHSRSGMLNWQSELAASKTYGGRLAVKAAAWNQSLGELSGGNQQKVVVAKWLATKPKVIILDEPTKGIDVGSKAAVHDFIGELAEDGLAVVLISSELPEVMGLADRILVMKEGRIVGEFARGAWSAEAIVGAATGASVAAEPARGALTGAGAHPA